MASAFDEVLAWAGAGRLEPARIDEALDALGAAPDGASWRRAAGLMSLWMGVVALAAGLIFFFAHNWQALTRLERIGIADVCGLAALAAYARYARREAQPAQGAALLFGVSLWVGSLLALVGQTYQTGADIWELFALWAALITPLALLGRSAAVWTLWALLCSLAVGRFYAHEEDVVALAVGLLNGGLLVCWAAGSRWLGVSGRFMERLLHTLMTGALTFEVMRIVVEERPGPGLGALLAAWVVTLVYYRRVRVDVYMLAMLCVSAIVVVTTSLVRVSVEIITDLLGLPLIGIGLLVVGMSALAARWLKRVGQEVRDAQR